MTLGNSVFGIFKTIFDILFKIKKFAFLEYHKLSVQNLEIFNKNKEIRKVALSVLVPFFDLQLWIMLPAPKNFELFHLSS